MEWTSSDGKGLGERAEGAGGVGTGAWSRSVRATRRVGLPHLLSHHGL